MGELERDTPTSRGIRPWVLAGFGLVFPERSQVLRAFYQDLDDRRRRRAGQFEDDLLDAAQCTPEEIIERIVADEQAGELFERAVHEALLTADADKRYLLAQVAGAALRGTTTPGQVEALKYLGRTVIALDSPDITLLVIMGTTEADKPRPAAGKESWANRDEILARWPGSPELLAPAASVLERAGLIEMRDFAMGGPVTSWALSPYGKQFLDYLLKDLGGWPPRRELEGR